jgi:probable addiction module antidote protein
MAIETTPFNASAFLTSVESQAELLADAFESGDATYIAHALDIVAKAKGRTTVKEANALSEVLFKALKEKENSRLSASLDHRSKRKPGMAPPSASLDFEIRDELLRDPENAAFYLQQILAGGDIELFQEALRTVVKAQQ